MQKIETITIDKQVSYVLTLQMLFLFFIGGAIFTGLTGVKNINVNGWLAVVVYIATLIIHELMHGIGFLLARAKPQYGISIAGVIPVAYTTSDNYLKITSMLPVAYLPFVSISVFYILFAFEYPQFQSLALIGFLSNFTGSVGDIWIASKLWKYIRFSDAKVRDTKSGIEVFSANKQALLTASRLKDKEKQRLKFGKQWAITSIVMLVIQTLSPIALKIIGYKDNYKLGFREFYLFETKFSELGHITGASFNLLSPILIGLMFTILSRFFIKLRIQKSANNSSR